VGLSEQESELLGMVREFVTDQGGDAASIVPQASLRDVGIDSLRAIDLVFRFEERCGIAIPMESFPTTTVGDALRYVAELIGRR
jgi:acyl carrier protein